MRLSAVLRITFFVWLIFWGTFQNGLGASAVQVASEEISDRDRWLASWLDDLCTQCETVKPPPIGLKVDGKPLDLAHRPCTKSLHGQDSGTLDFEVVWPGDGLLPTIHLKGKKYTSVPVVEWTAYVIQKGAANSLLIEDIRGANFSITGIGPRALLHHFTGSLGAQGDFEPRVDTLQSCIPLSFAPVGGRSSNGVMPYFNIEGSDRGLILAVGWPGQWSVDITAGLGNAIEVQAGQQTTHMVLHPSEAVRTPRMVVQFYRGSWERAQNVWRAWMLSFNNLNNDRPPTQPMLCGTATIQLSMSGNEWNNASLTSESLLSFLDSYNKRGLQLNCWMIDSGWQLGPSTGIGAGTWQLDRGRFPNGLAAISTASHRQGMKLSVWFEPERVLPGTALYTEHPEWLLAPTKPYQNGLMIDNSWRLLNLGNQQGRRWLVQTVDRMVTSEDIDIYRFDFNVDPLPFWNAADAPDRLGVTENLYIQGFLSYLDELKERHPELIIDNCASGGRRADVETMRRTIMSGRSDYLFEPVGGQSHTYGIAYWLPYQGSVTLNRSPNSTWFNQFPQDRPAYVFRSHMAPFFTLCYDPRDERFPINLYLELIAQYRHISPFFLDDYWPLTSYSRADDAWIAFQFGDHNRGAVQAFRRKSATETLKVRLRGIDQEAVYLIEDIDSGVVEDVRGHRLAEEGIVVRLNEAQSAALISYARKN
ncbi:MAG: alpha-galactosidase [Desulfomonile tiedjei]|uniref:Alpha-galactosidase n=1 Tax=Desulfomonile tiedjei TaxID=2358 RepID=A0A9D6V5R1_9BACT|nr:alpha-galactosidase [Desulfomonile tiedjei]